MTEFSLITSIKRFLFDLQGKRFGQDAESDITNISQHTNSIR